MTKEQFIAQIARLLPIVFEEDESWTDDQAEDGILTLNALIQHAVDLQAQQPKPLRVLVEVYGGVVEVTECPAGVEVEILDHDNLGDGP